MEQCGEEGSCSEQRGWKMGDRNKESQDLREAIP